VDQAEAHSILQARYERLCSSVVAGYRRYRRYPNRTIHRRSTRANIVNDEILSAVIQEFHDDPTVKPVMIRSKNLRFMQVDDRVLLWFKKIDRQRNPAIYPTEHAIALQSGQQSMFPDYTVLIVGYLLNRDETDVVRVSISKPNGRSRRPAWFIDLEPSRERKLSVVSKTDGTGDDKPRFRIVVKHGAVQNKLITS